MTLYTLFRSHGIAHFVLWSMLIATPILAQERPQQSKLKDRSYPENIHLMRHRMFADHAASGEIKHLGEIRKFGYEAWRNMTNPTAFKSLATTAWKSVTATGSQGGLTSGRTRSIAFHPTDAGVVYIATAQGGIWKTNNIYEAPAPTWVSLSEKLPTLAMGAIAVDPKNPDIIFAGTGETNGGWGPGSGGTPAGTGLYRSKDGGLNWDLVGPTSTVGYNCSEIVIDPKNSKNIFVATGNNSGVVRSTDGGDTWTKVQTGFAPVSIEINPDDPRYVYASGQSGPVYRSEDGGTTWTKCTLTGVSSSNRIQLAISPSTPRMIYASVFRGSSTEIHLSEDHGATWTRQAQYTDDPQSQRSSSKVNFLWSYSQGNYASAFVAHPTDSARLLGGGLFIVYSSDKGKTVRMRSDNWAFPGASNYVHADVHHLEYNPLNKHLFALSDGGVSYSQNHGVSWTNVANAKIGTLQFVGVDADRAFTFVVGGTQDNGTNKALINDESWKEVRGGDGGMVLVAQENPDIFFGTSVSLEQGSYLFKTHDGGKTWWSDDQGNQRLNRHADIDNNLDFYPRYEISSDGSTVLLAGPGSAYISYDGGGDGFAYKAVTSTGASLGRPWGLHIAPNSPDKMWVTVSKKVYYTTDMGQSWSASPNLTTTGTIMGITSDPNDPSKVYLVSAGAAATKGKNFARSYDGGQTWEYPATQLPSIPYWSIARSNNGHLFIGSDFGVLYSTDEGATWAPLGQGLPLLQTTSLKVRGENNQYLLAGTYGRGAWYIDISTLGSVNASTMPKTIAVGQSYPNPVTPGTSEVSLKFDLEQAGDAQLVLFDALGREIKTLARDRYMAGEHTITFNVSELEAGTYFYSLTSNGQTVSDKLIVTK